MDDKERLETVRAILNQVANREEFGRDGCGIWVYWGMDTEMSAESVEKPALEALKKFEAKVREDEDLSINNPITSPYEV